MSHRYEEKGEDYSRHGGTMAGLIIFILIILQFQNRNRFKEEGNCCKKERNSCREERSSCKEEHCCIDGGNNQLFDNSVLFILVLFIIACCGMGRGRERECGCGSGSGRGLGIL